MSKWLGRLEEVIVVFTLVTMSIIAFVNVLTRNFFDVSLAFTEEITVNLFVFLTFIGAAIGVRRHAHLGFTLLVDKVSLTLRRGLIGLIGLISVLFFLLIAYYGVEMLLFQMNINATTPALGWPRWMFSLAIPIGTTLCAIRTVEATVKQLKNLSENEGDSV